MRIKVVFKNYICLDQYKAHCPSESNVQNTPNLINSSNLVGSLQIMTWEGFLVGMWDNTTTFI